MFVALGACSGGVFSQKLTDNQVPVVVKKGIKNKFPNTGKVEWKLKTDKNYEAEFKLNRIEIAVKFDSSGKWLETESEIKESQLPSAVRNVIAKDYLNYKIIETQTVEFPDGKEKLYEIHIKKGKEVVKLLLSGGGKTIDKKVKKEK